MLAQSDALECCTGGSFATHFHVCRRRSFSTSHTPPSRLPVPHSLQLSPPSHTRFTPQTHQTFPSHPTNQPTPTPPQKFSPRLYPVLSLDGTVVLEVKEKPTFLEVRILYVYTYIRI